MPTTTSPALRHGFNSRRVHVVFLALNVLSLLSLLPSSSAWSTARATWYDDHPWMSVHDGSCMYGYLGDRFGGKGNWHVGAINDGHRSYSGSCGRCYQIRCQPGVFKDNYGASLDRSRDCKNQDPITIVITDTCPCSKPNNAYSNTRWCCGDMDHFDIGIWAFQKFADPGKGVIMIQYQEVACPSDWAVELSSRQNPSSLRNQYPWDLSSRKKSDQPSGAMTPSQALKVSAFQGPNNSTSTNSTRSPSPSPSPSWSPSPSPRSPSPPSPSSNTTRSPSPSPSPSNKWSPSPSNQKVTAFSGSG